jgi:uncharacterized protein YcgI (DUF1989 family)
MAERLLVAAGGGAGLRLKRGEQLRIIDIEGGQTGDLVAFSADGRHRLSSGRTFDYGGKIYVSTGDVLWSDRSEPMLTIVADDVGKHDLLYAPCSIEMYRLQYGVTEYHANCHTYPLTDEELPRALLCGETFRMLTEMGIAIPKEFLRCRSEFV